MNDTFVTKYYEYNFYYDNVLIENFIFVELKKFTYHSVSFDILRSQLNNKYYEYQLSISNININETIQPKYYGYGF